MSSPTEGRDLVLSYQRLLNFEAQMLSIKSMLEGVLAMKGTVDDLSIRVIALEQIQAMNIATKSVWNTIRTFLYGAASTIFALVTAIIAGGYLGILPKLWGG